MQPVWGWRALGLRFVIALAIVSVVTASSFAYAYWFANEQLGRTTKADIRPGVLRTTGDSTQAANYLIVGSDSRAFVHDKVAQEHFGDTTTNPENLADVIMIAHVDPKSPGKGFLVSIPRDTYVPIPGHGTQKINAAFSHGPGTLIQTINQDFHVPIDHYMQVGFATFADIVNAIGRVHIFFPAAAYDHETGLNITTPGCHALDGLDALAYARSRKYYYKTPEGWKQDGTADLGRIKRQQYFIRSLAQEAINDGARNPLTARAIVEKVTAHLVIDKNMGLNDLLSLVRAFRSVNPADVHMITLPTTSDVLNPGPHPTDIQRVDEAQAAPIFSLLGSFAKTTTKKVSPRDIKVQVLNGSGVKGIAATTEHALVADGFLNGAAPADADNHNYAYTQVRYTAGHEAEAQAVASYLGGVGLLTRVSASLGSADVVVVTGSDFTAVAKPGAHAKPSTTATTAFPNPGQTQGVKIPQSDTGLPTVGCG